MEEGARPARALVTAKRTRVFALSPALFSVPATVFGTKEVLNKYQRNVRGQTRELSNVQRKPEACRICVWDLNMGNQPKNIF